MATPLNLTGVEASNDLYGVILGLDQGFGGVLHGLIYISLYMVLLIMLLRYNPVPESLIAAAAPGFVLSLILFWLGFHGPVWIVVQTVLLLVGVLAAYKSNSA